MPETKDAIPLNYTLDADTRRAMELTCRTWYKVEITRHQERIAVTREWLEHGDGIRGYVFAPGKVENQESILEARVEKLEMTDVVRALYGPIAP